ncbi:DUF6173 family protein [Oceaniglobus roseus]|uniref:DUF6173 family protein n=1 Tax=Oceaniglobus roseus TaxID=1737570 RepID=UPI000C7EEB57|nr:DUF6173 family protein [Kandeliimicrobium roseum]
MSDEIQTTAEAAEAAAMPRAHAVHTDPDAPCAEREQLPATLAKTPLSRKSPAEWAYQRLVLYIRTFEKQLDGDHEVAMGFVGGAPGVMRIEGMGYYDPDIVTFYGSDPSGTRTQLIQHVGQLNVMLRALPKADKQAEPARIGFRLSADLEGAEAAEPGEPRP